MICVVLSRPDKDPVATQTNRIDGDANNFLVRSQQLTPAHRDFFTNTLGCMAALDFVMVMRCALPAYLLHIGMHIRMESILGLE